MIVTRLAVRGAWLLLFALLPLLSIALLAGRLVPSSGEIRYLAYTNTRQTIFTLDVDHEITLPVPHVFDQNENFLSWSPDGRYLVVTEWAEATYFINWQTGTRTRLVDRRAESVVWSRDNSRMLALLPNDTFQELYIANADGTDAHLVLRSNSMNITSAIFSPDQQHILIWNNQLPNDCNFYIVDLAGSDLRCIVEDFESIFWFNWSPDETQLLFGVPNGDMTAFTTYAVNPDGSDLRPFAEVGDSRSLAFSADGKEMVFVQTSDAGSPLIILANLDGTDQRVFTLDNAPTDGYAYLLPDEQYLVYSAYDLNRGELLIYILDPVTGDLLREFQNRSLIWSTDSQQYAHISFGVVSDICFGSIVSMSQRCVALQPDFRGGLVWIP